VNASSPWARHPVGGGLFVYGGETHFWTEQADLGEKVPGGGGGGGGGEGKESKGFIFCCFLLIALI